MSLFGNEAAEFLCSFLGMKRQSFYVPFWKGSGNIRAALTKPKLKDVAKSLKEKCLTRTYLQKHVILHELIHKNMSYMPL